MIISITILLILGSQVYRTVNSYQLNKQRFINDVQLALDLSVEKYYADKARNKFAFMMLSSDDSIKGHSISSYSLFSDSLMLDTEVMIGDDSVMNNQPKNGFSYSWSNARSDEEESVSRIYTDSTEDVVKVTRIDVTSDSAEAIDRFPFKIRDFTRLTQKVIISTSEQRMNIGELRAILEDELDRKGLTIGFELDYEMPGIKEVSKKSGTNYSLTTTSKSTYLGNSEALKIHFENASLLILKRGAWDLLLSFAIVFSVIAALLYLYRIIRNQKELAMIKDDLIGNVTHEFKTPIATVTSALEGIANFNEADDKEKTKRYLQMSRDQLAKLNVMVEKLMETATIDSGEIEINKVETDLTELTSQVAESFKVRMGEKALKVEIPEESIWGAIDPFHWENVLSNLLDNAIKYGGNEITLKLRRVGQGAQFQVIDNGSGIEKFHQSRIFEKLYRIPKGNQHDVKGFGIGLYYTRAIVEGHGGKITVESGTNRTCFIVTL